MTRNDIMVLGRELTEDGERRGPVGLPAAVWDKHIALVGATGSGKSTAASTAIATAHPHTDGPTIVLDPKGTGWLEEIARAHFARTESLDNVLYFDATACLPALSVFDLRRDLTAGFDREQVVENIAEHFIELLEHAKPGGFAAIRSPDAIRYVIAALFDPVHGDDVFRLEALIETIRRIHTSRALPEVSTDRYETLLADLTLGQKRTVDNVLDGALTRVEKFYASTYLAPLFNHAPPDPADGFAFDDWLDEDVLILIDLSGPERRTQRILANLLLEALWRALTRRDEQPRHADPAQTLLFVDEVANLRIDAVLERLLSMGREYGIGVVPMLQYPGQLDTDGASAANAQTDASAELITNCQSVLTGSVTSDDALVEKLSGAHMSAAEVSNRLTNLRQDWWLFSPASPRDAEPIRTFTIAEAPLPPGHPDGQAPLSDAQQEAFAEALRVCRQQACDTNGIAISDDETAADTTPGNSPDPTAATAAPTDSLHAALRHSGFQTTLPLVDTLPGTAKYEPAANAVVCDTCGANRPATIEGLRDTLACHGSLADIDRAAIPPVALGLTLTDDEIGAAPIDLRLLCVLQIIANMAHKRYTPLEVDLVHDSPHDVLGLFGGDSQDIHHLKKEGLITVDKLRGYSYYTVTTAGRDLLQQPHRKGVEWGHGSGDNTETLVHIAMVEALTRYAEAEYADDPDSPVAEVVPYFEVSETERETNLDGGTRFDVVGLDSEAHIRLIGEAERHNNDAATAAVADYDQITTVAPDHALWAVPSSSTGHDAVLTPLADPPDDTPRIDGYSEQTRIPSISGVDEPGMTDIVTLNELRKHLEAPSLSEPS